MIPLDAHVELDIEGDTVHIVLSNPHGDDVKFVLRASAIFCTEELRTFETESRYMAGSEPDPPLPDEEDLDEELQTRLELAKLRVQRRYCKGYVDGQLPHKAPDLRQTIGNIIRTQMDADERRRMNEDIAFERKQVREAYESIDREVDE